MRLKTCTGKPRNPSRDSNGAVTLDQSRDRKGAVAPALPSVKNMKVFDGKTLSWKLLDGVIELALHREPCNEIGSQTLEDLERFAEALVEEGSREAGASAVIIYSSLPSGFCAGADLRELYYRSQEVSGAEKISGVRDFLTRIHRVLN